jgi:cytochrome o ubiquinol oxidase subunit 2
MRNLLLRFISLFKNVKTTLLILVLALLIMFGIGFATMLSGAEVPVLDPKGDIARQQKDLLIISTLLMLIVVVPVFVLLFTISVKFRASNTKATYRPDWDHSRKLETIWWGVPILIIAILASITWVTSHTLDPFRPLASDQKPLRIQVVALQWKWLFIYPEEKVASVNEVALPINRPVTFEITSDAPMNSFWIPSLAGQVYAMSGMTTKLHVIGDTAGTFRGSSANISGEGFAGMHFDAKVLSGADYGAWILDASSSTDILDQASYAELAKASKDAPVRKFSAGDDTLFGSILHKYMAPQANSSDTTEHRGESADGGTEDTTHAH